jgi:hypothetical protein
MKTGYATTGDTTTAASVAAEDLKRGEFVAVLSQIVEFPSFLWSHCLPSEQGEVVRIRCTPADTGVPLKVKAICLPYVFVKPPTGPCHTIDVRHVQLVRLNERYAKLVWKNVRKQQSRLKLQAHGR